MVFVQFLWVVGEVAKQQSELVIRLNLGYAAFGCYPITFLRVDKGWITMSPWRWVVTMTHVCDIGTSSTPCETLIFGNVLALEPAFWEEDNGLDLEAGCNNLCTTVLPSSISTSRRRGLIASTKQSK